MIFFGARYVFGVDPELFSLPIVNLPQDTLKVRRRFRNDMPAMAFVKTPEGVFRYVLLLTDGGLALEFLQGANLTDSVNPRSAIRDPQ